MRDEAPRGPAPGLLTARLLGRVELSIGGRSLTADHWPPRGGRALLLLLLATPGHRLGRDRILELLWPDLPPDSARNAYYKALHSLRRTLEPELAPRAPGRFVIATADALALAADRCVVDADAFLAELGTAAPSASRKASLRSAVERYDGGLFGDEPLDDWAAGPRRRFQRDWIGAVLELAELEIAAGEAALAIPRLEAVVAAEPTHEAAHRLLIRAYDADGQRDRAWRQYERCVAVLRDELGVDPSAETRRLGTRLRDLDLVTPAERRRASSWRGLPTPPTRLIGREREVDEILDLIRTGETRLLTLIGPGGVGKTRLALEAALAASEQFAAGACFVSLGAVRDPAQVAPAIARDFGLREEGGEPPLAQVCAALRDGAALLVLDNFEQVLPAAADIAEILAACPALTILVTSREPLRLRAERLYDVPPLAAPRFDDDLGSPPTIGAIGRAGAVMLFVERAAAVRPGFALDETNAVDVARICARLDGLPLAIELAAARSRELIPRELLGLLHDRLGALTEGYRDLPPRQRTMRDAIAWSHDLLDPALKTLFRRIAAFPGGVTAAVAARLTADTAETAAARLQTLADKRLVQWVAGGDEPRAGMLETTREFGLEQLALAGEVSATRDALAAHAVDLATAAAEHLSGPAQGAWLDRLDAEHDNLRAALAWTIDRGDAGRAFAIAGNLWRYWWSRGYLTEGRRWLELALALPAPPDRVRRGHALNGAASLAESQGEFTRSTALHREALALWRALGVASGEARALSGLGTAAAHRGDYATARAHHERALAIARASGDVPGAARTLDRLGTVARHQGDTARAAACYTESLELFRAAGDLVNASIVLSNLGEVRHQQGQRERAAELFEEALRIQRELDLPDGVAFDLTNLARVRLELGELDRAAALSNQGARLFRDLGNQLGLAGALAVCGMVARAGGDPRRSRDFLTASLRILAELDERSAMPEHLEQLAAAVLDGGEPERAARLLGAAAALREQIASPPSPDDRRQADAVLAASAAILGAAAAARAVAAGRAQPLHATLADALGDCHPTAFTALDRT
jgi:predicted ATPase/DNA-binding SARP family transcriptional activator